MLDRFNEKEDDALFQEEFEDELIAGADVDYDTFTEEYIDTLVEYLSIDIRKESDLDA